MSVTPNKIRAWLLAPVRLEDGGLVLGGLRIYSERYPSGTVRQAAACLLEGSGRDFAEAEADVRRQMETTYPWLVPFVR